MTDIFISYSRKDSEHALQLAERLQGAGMSVWIDQRGIEAAKTWSEEIVNAIEGSKAFVLLLSSHSIESDNVARELSLAFESKRPLLPVAIEDVALPAKFKYQLAGIQRVAYLQHEAIEQALISCGIQHRSVKATEVKKSLMILPFEDLSPTGDNGWFADGIASELISALSNIKSLRVTDAQTTKDYKRYQGTLADFAREMSIRYFVQGDVRKFGDDIKISARLLDIENGDHLWQDMLKGTMQDVFDIQEQVAKRVVHGLKLHLGKDEKEKLEERGTENAEAYELLLKARDYFYKHTEESKYLAIKLTTEALRLDPNFSRALTVKAQALVGIYAKYRRDQALLEEAEQLAKKAFLAKVDNWPALDVLAGVYQRQGKLAEAEAAAKEYVKRMPQDSHSHFGLGYFYQVSGRPADAIPHYERALELQPDFSIAYHNLVGSADLAHDAECATKWARLGLPHYERLLRLAPDDETAAVDYATLLLFAGERRRAAEIIGPLLEKKSLDSANLYAIGCIYLRLEDIGLGIEALKRAVDAGFAAVDSLRTDPDLDPLRELPEFKKLMQKMEEKHANV